jgi:hypothetical protein
MPTIEPSTNHVTAGSVLRVIVYACHTWWYHRVFFTLGGEAGEGVL